MKTLRLMMMLVLSLALILVTSGCASIKKDAGFYAATTAIAADYATTYIALYEREGFEEVNPLYGKNPSKTKFNLINAGILGFHLWMNTTDERKFWNTAITITKGAATINNVWQLNRSNNNEPTIKLNKRYEHIKPPNDHPIR